MATIPLTGPISWSTLRSTLVNTGTAPFGLSGAGRPTWTTSQPYSPGTPLYVPKNRSSSSLPDDASPFSISEWRGYDHEQSKDCTATSFTTRNISRDYTYYKARLTGADGYTSSISIQSNSAPNSNVAVKIYTTYPFSNTGALTNSTPALSYDLNGAQTQTLVFTMSNFSDVYLHLVAWEYQI
jgi:hypothetical protein